MGLHFELSTQQINGIASYINLKDIQDYINTHQAEYEQFLKEEEQTIKNHKFFYGSFILKTAVRKKEKIEMAVY